MKRILSATIILSLMCTLLATSGVVALADDEIYPEVNVAGGDPKSLSPLQLTGDGKAILQEMYETVLDRNGFGGEIYGVLAKDWYWEGDDLYFELYDYIYDSAGNHFTADDAIFSFNTEYEAGYFSKSQYLTDDWMEAVDDYTVVMHCVEGSSDVVDRDFDMLSNNMMFTQAAYEGTSDNLANTSIGTGRYTCSNFISGSTITLERRDDYWQEPDLIWPLQEANVQTINYSIISETAQLVNALKTDQIDYINNVTPESVEEFMNDPDYTVKKYQKNTIFLAIPNCNEASVCSDINFRAALFYAVDSQDIVAALGGDEFAIQGYCMGTSNCTEYNPEWETEEDYYTVCDLDLAKEYLDKSSYNGETIKLIVQNTDFGSYYEAVALVFGAACDQLGIKYSIEMLEDAQYRIITETEHENWDLCFSGSSSNNSVAGFYTNLVSLQNDGQNMILGIIDDELMDLYLEAYNANTISQETVDALEEYCRENFYAYGAVNIYMYDVFKSDVMTDNCLTFRNWFQPGGFKYVTD